MHVLQLGPYPPPRGGVQTNMLAIQDELLKNGCRSSIISITKGGNNGNHENLYLPRSSYQLLRLILTLEYDILHLHIGGNLSVRLQMLIFICGMFSRGKSVMTFHSGGYAVSKQGQNASPWGIRGFVFRRLDRIIVVNKSMIEMFRKFGVKPNRILMISPFALEKPGPEIIIPKKFRAFWEDHERILITVGLLETDYDLPQQIEVMEKVLSRYPKTGLVIIGSGSIETTLRDLIASKPFAEHIMLAGDTPRDVVLRLIEDSDLMLRTTVFDGDAISIREALFLGTPVIATDNGMRPDGVTLIGVRNIDQLLAAIESEFENSPERVKSTDDGLENIRAILSTYRELCSPEESNSHGQAY